MDTVIGIGELLWDVFPSGKRLGGAPVNFAYHCAQMGAQAVPVSAVGKDALGDEILDTLKGMHLDTSQIAQNERPTGTVEVTLDDTGKPSYEIKQAVAWDWIGTSPALEAIAAEADALCFGSLAQRSMLSMTTIHKLLGAMRPEALKVFDINLRQAFYDQATIRESLEKANVFKLSDEELPVIAKMFGLEGDIESQLNSLLETFKLKLIAYTRGGEGSLLMSPDAQDDNPGNPVNVVDSVGAGDSFTATVCMGLLNGRSLPEINAHANAVARYVCSQEGATPRLPDSLIPTEYAAKTAEI